ncbi:hypothetical protein IQ276_019320 [Desmonostoc muscorum LEGE 12446]|uniref:hypothetical protein n=1 Tax=Desmonostoc muscorum TaxID=1179 RepID=UPI001F170E53|nr:hypothetical protein [Desmonostoc muscorum]MCF2148538.1 hypothetical protein [Desmonostoc muscorum LEGE 12446]
MKNFRYPWRSHENQDFEKVFPPEKAEDAGISIQRYTFKTSVSSFLLGDRSIYAYSDNSRVL